MRKPSIFVVDDEPQICTLLTRILPRDGYTVRAFTSGRDAIAAFSEERPDVLLTDLTMPGMSGLELVRLAREALPSIGTILTTGFASPDDLVDALRSGVDDFVTKPFKVDEILAVVARVLERSRSAASGGAAARAGAARPAEPALANVVLARRLRDLNVMESVHALIADETPTSEILPRCAGLIESVLGARRAVLVAPGASPGSFHVTSTSVPAKSGDAIASAAIASVVATGFPAAINSASLGTAAALFDSGPLAAAPLCPRDTQGPDCGAFVASRPAGASEFGVEELHALGVIANALGSVHRASRTLERAERAYVESLCDVVAATEARSTDFARHSERVRELSVALGRRLALGAHDLEVLEIAARLCDIGRVDTPDALLRKTSRPDAGEWELLRRHAARADELVRPLGRLKHVKPVIRHHHENWDGSGYPDRLRGDQIPYLSSLVRITDSFAALTSARAWRPAFDAKTAVRQIVELSGRHFHPQLVAAFAEMQGETGAGRERTP